MVDIFMGWFFYGRRGVWRGSGGEWAKSGENESAGERRV